jgi:hypothetical protein
VETAMNWTDWWINESGLPTVCTTDGEYSVTLHPNGYQATHALDGESIDGLYHCVASDAMGAAEDHREEHADDARYIPFPVLAGV